MIMSKSTMSVIFLLCCLLLNHAIAQNCEDDESWESDYGRCRKYEEGENNHRYCDEDRGDDGRLAEVACPEACDTCPEEPGGGGGSGIGPPPGQPGSSDCKDTDSWDAGWGGCGKYESGESNHQYCGQDRDNGVLAETACPVACGTCEPSGGQGSDECKDSSSWDAGWGGCLDYRQGEVSHQYCDQDRDNGVLAWDACPDACGKCDNGSGPGPQITPDSPDQSTNAPDQSTSAPDQSTPDQSTPHQSTPDQSTPDQSTITPSADDIEIDFNLDDVNSLIWRVDVTLSKKADVYIEYAPKVKASPSHVALRSPTSYNDDEHEIYLLRLIADTKYNYQIFVDGKELADDSFQTGSIPTAVADREVDIDKGSGEASVEMFVSPRQNKPYWYIYDKYGTIVWFLERTQGAISVDGGMWVKGDGNILYTVDGGGFIEFSPTGKTVYDGDNGCIILHHSISTCTSDDENTIWSIGMTRHRVTGVEPDQAVDVLAVTDTSTGQQFIEIDLIDFVDPALSRAPSSNIEYDPRDLFNCAPDSQNGPVNDWAHVNYIDVSNDKSFVLMTARNLGLVWAFKKRSGGWSFEWQLGGRNGSDFTFPNRNDKFYGQHSAKMLPNGNVLLFDNGKGRPSNEGGGYSRALELELNFNSMQASAVWEFVIEENGGPCQADHRGNVQRLSNGNTIVVVPVCVHSGFEIGHVFEVDQYESVIVHIIQPFEPMEHFLLDAIAINSIYGETFI